jgi:hypothetical protein
MDGHNTSRRDTKPTDSLLRPVPACAAAWFLDYGHMMDKVLYPSDTHSEFYPDSIGLERPLMPPITEDLGTTTTGLTSDHLGYLDRHGLLPLATRNMNLGEVNLYGLT